MVSLAIDFQLLGGNIVTFMVGPSILTTGFRPNIAPLHGPMQLQMVDGVLLPCTAAATALITNPSTVDWIFQYQC